ncbi:MAG: hypothetical protein CVV64_06050 [Candidatus Wallbacteria bacterium HGW-Wallbacteria-1]|jgi:tetratricopeptide (TPR) repeat protein|uniref:Tetratricopeptide repeat protein n=1 Tax=Candidatus Wallbacteria bacterium HGW-Wallbacteria-1 TaxID=2013854 RepID=A0A2N1PSK9_9BACT|nr:MAG: hypothetical protein CVV64_06050 [Candidatus Wallbacteria bacterium HGW-Wallbacteria-1]
MKRHNISSILQALVFLALALALTGCEGGRLGSGGLTPIGNAEEYITAGWEKFDKGQYSTSINDFNSALEREPSAKQRAEAQMGLGWSYGRRDGIQSGQAYFEASQDYFADAKMGLAGCYFSNANREDYFRAIDILERIGLSSVDYCFKPLHNIGVSNAEAHALIGILYYYTGNEASAQAHLEEAKTNDDRISTAVDQIYTQLSDIL